MTASCKTVPREPVAWVRYRHDGIVMICIPHEAGSFPIYRDAAPAPVADGPKCARCDDTGCPECDPEWAQHQAPVPGSKPSATNQAEREAVTLAAKPANCELTEAAPDPDRTVRSDKRSLTTASAPSGATIARLCEWRTAEYIAACSPEIVAALVRVAMAARQFSDGTASEDDLDRALETLAEALGDKHG